MEAMRAQKFWMVVPALLIGGVVGLASAKLPAPPPADPAKAAAAKAKAAEGAKKAAAAMAKAQDRAAENYKRNKGGMSAMAPDPGKKKMK